LLLHLYIKFHYQMENDKNKKKTSFKQRLRRKYRLIVYNDSDFQPVYQMKYSRFLFLGTWITGILLIIACIYSLVAFTPIRETIPGYPTTSMKLKMLYNAKLVDSLEYELQLRDQYFANISSIVLGKEPINIESKLDSVNSNEEYNFISLFNDTGNAWSSESMIDNAYFISDEKKINANISSLHFFSPVNGMITRKFDSRNSHFGTDIVASSEEVVKAILPGTVILATWTLETGHVIQLQHDHNLVSFYKHNAELLKKEGNHVDAGEPIAIIGNSGELTTGPHLHFELWHNMIPIDPEDYINF